MNLGEKTQQRTHLERRGGKQEERTRTHDVTVTYFHVRPTIDSEEVGIDASVSEIGAFMHGTPFLVPR